MNRWFGQVYMLFVILLTCLSCSTVPSPDTPSVGTSLTAEDTFEPSRLPTETLTPSPERTLITATSPRTPIPTLLGQDVSAMVAELMANNNGCLFPCWWGITPGVTDWDDAYHFLSQFDPDITSSASPDMEFGNNVYQIRNYHVEITYTADSLHGIGASFTTFDNVITIISVGGAPGRALYLPNLLGIYGKPGNVYIYTMDASPDNVLPFFLLLYYPAHNFAINYDILAVREGDNVIGCPQSVPAEIWSWSFPEGREDYVDARRVQEWVIGTRSRNYFMALEDATNLDIESFFRIYSDSQTSICIETPANLWP